MVCLISVSCAVRFVPGQRLDDWALVGFRNNPLPFVIAICLCYFHPAGLDRDIPGPAFVRKWRIWLVVRSRMALGNGFRGGGGINFVVRGLFRLILFPWDADEVSLDQLPSEGILELRSILIRRQMQLSECYSFDFLSRFSLFHLIQIHHLFHLTQRQFHRYCFD
jgi:hypothetical protein